MFSQRNGSLLATTSDGRVSHGTVRFTVMGNGSGFGSSLRARYRRVTTHVSTKVRPVAVVVATVVRDRTYTFFLLCVATLMDLCIGTTPGSNLYPVMHRIKFGRETSTGRKRVKDIP